MHVRGLGSIPYHPLPLALGVARHSPYPAYPCHRMLAPQLAYCGCTLLGETRVRLRDRSVSGSLFTTVVVCVSHYSRAPAWDSPEGCFVNQEPPGSTLR